VKILVENYTFDAADQVVTLTDYASVVAERLLMITNITDGIIIHQFNVPGKRAMAIGNFFVLEYDTLGMDDTDLLQIWYDDVPATGNSTNVASSATNVTLLAANTSRFGATIFNDSTSILYLKLGATASATSFTVKMDAGDYFETPYDYTGIIDGLWASANGSARITEVS